MALKLKIPSSIYDGVFLQNHRVSGLNPAQNSIEVWMAMFKDNF